MEQAAERLRIVSAQINTQANNFRGNINAIRSVWSAARHDHVDLVVTPELSISGYPLEDSVENPDLLAAARKGLEELRAMTAKGGPALIVGLPQRLDGGQIYNTAVLLDRGEIKGIVRKSHLPNYDVFDEKRNFAAGTYNGPLEFRGRKIGVLICEDTWFPDVAKRLKDDGAEVLISVNASPFEIGKMKRRLNDVIYKRASETGLPILYVNQVGGQDQVVFDGYSAALNANGKLAYLARGFDECRDVLTLNFPARGVASFRQGPVAKEPENPLESVYMALVTGTRDYLGKIGYSRAVLGMSGGIDSALVAAIAADALGPENVSLYRLPSKFTSDLSNNEATNAARMLGCPIDTITIEPAVQALRQSLKPRFDAAVADGRKTSVDLSDENLQARVRGTILMSLSNAGEGLLLTTGNKSEVSVGYCTLYGDTNGGFNPIKDVYKTMVFDLCRWRNANHRPGLKAPAGTVIPEAIINRPPSAELAPGQVDTNSLPPYPVLDAILKGYVEDRKSIAAIVAETEQPETLVREIIRKVDAAEFKRQQGAPGVKITSRSFGKGRRYPIAQPALPKALSGMGINP